MYMKSKKFYSAIAALLIAIPLAHGDEHEINRVIVFGDSLSDGGFFSGQSFTTNPDPVAPEVFARQLGLEVNPVYGEGGTNFAVGGARVTAPNSLSIPIATQIDNFLNSGGRFRNDDVVYIQGGGNDYFAFVVGGGTDPSILTNAAAGLAEQVARIQAAGGAQIVTMAVQSGGSAAVQAFNDAYESALVANRVNALYFDTDALFNEMVQFANEFGFTNLVDSACGAVNSRVCTPADYVSPDANETYLRADSVHPAGKAQRIQGQAIASLLLAPEQVGQLSYAAQSLLRSHRQLTQSPLRSGYGQDEGETAYFVNLAHHNFSNEASAQTTGVEEDSLVFGLGLDHKLAEQTSVGLAVGISDGEGEFDFNRGDYQVDAVSALFYAQGRVEQIHISADMMVGRANYDALTRQVQLGPLTRHHEGDTEADFYGVGAAVSYYIDVGSDFHFVPRVGLDYQDLKIEAYRERGSLSTSAHFGDQELDSLNASLGFSFRNTRSSTLHFYLDAQFNRELKDDGRTLSITPSGAPIRYTSELYLADEKYISARLGAAYRITDAVVLDAGATAIRERDELDSTTFFIGVSLEM